MEQVTSVSTVSELNTGSKTYTPQENVTSRMNLTDQQMTSALHGNCLVFCFAIYLKYFFEKCAPFRALG